MFRTLSELALPDREQLLLSLRLCGVKSQSDILSAISVLIALCSVTVQNGISYLYWLMNRQNRTKAIIRPIMDH